MADVFWVTRSADRDRVVAAGARLELSPSGEILNAAWEAELLWKGETMAGSLAVAPHLGGGFVHWTGARVFRSREFTGPLDPVELPLAGAARVQGARNGLRGVVIFTEEGPCELPPGSLRARGLMDAGVLDFAALDASRAIRIDVFGRVATTGDGGAGWIDASAVAGIAVGELEAAPDELAIRTWQGRIALDEGGALGPLEVSARSGRLIGSYFQLVFPARPMEDERGWIWREMTPLSAAVSAGALLPDGSALAVVLGSNARVDLQTGDVRRAETKVGQPFDGNVQADWFPQGLQCQPFQAEDSVLFLCGWESGRGYGGVVMRTDTGEPPRVERVFSDDGYFIGDDDGALAYAGSCRVKPRLIDVNELYEEQRASDSVQAACVRRGPGDWVERRVDVEPGMELYGWAARRDGTAVAIVFDPRAFGLPEPARGPGRVTDQGGLRVVRVFREIEGWQLPPGLGAGGELSMMRGSGLLVDKRWRARADGSLDGWLSLPESPEMASTFPSRGVTLRPDGRPLVHDLPPKVMMTAVTGDFGVAMTEGGQLYETLDHGRSWKQAGFWPAPLTHSTASCSRLGCAIGAFNSAGNVVRLGWGASRRAYPMNNPGVMDPNRVTSRRIVPVGPLRLICTPTGVAVPLRVVAADPEPVHRLQTRWGETLEVVREPGAPSEPLPQSSAPGPSGARLGTHSLLFRPPFEPEAPIRRIDATVAGAGGWRDSHVTPLLEPDGGIAFLAIDESQELLIRGDQITVWPPFESRRYDNRSPQASAGVLSAAGHPLVLGEARSRPSLEEHGFSPGRPPMFIGPSRERESSRPMTLARRDDGTMGILVLDGAAPETAGIAEIRRTTASLSPVSRLSPWSSAVAASDPRCRADKDAWQAVLILEPSQWFVLDSRALPGVNLGGGLMRVRWGRERVCVQAIDLAADDLRPAGESMAESRLVVRWATGARRGGEARAVLRSNALRQDLSCTLGPPGAD